MQDHISLKYQLLSRRSECDNLNDQDGNSDDDDDAVVCPTGCCRVNIGG